MILLLFFLSFWLGLSFPYLAFFLGFIFLLFVLIRFKKKIAIIASAVFLIGFGASFIKPTYSDSTITGFVYETKENYFLINHLGERLYVYMKGHSCEIGDILTLDGEKEELSFTRIESQFDFEQYLNNRGVFASFQVDKVQINFSFPLRIRAMRNSALSSLSERASSLIKAILFGDVDYQSDTTDNLQDMHLTKLISSSGIYISSFINFLVFLFGYLVKDKTAKIISLGVLSFYFIFTFPRFSVLRLLIIYIAKMVNEYSFKKRFSYLSLLSFIGISFLLMNKYLVFQDSFILGFSIPLFTYFTSSIGKNKKKIIRKVISLTLIYLFFLPFELKYYSSLAPLSSLITLLLTPLYILFSITGLLTFYQIPLSGAVNYLANFITVITSLFRNINFQVYAPLFSQIGCFVYYGLYFSFLYYFSIGFKPVYKAISLISTVTLLLYFLPIKNSVSKEVTFINVGQGDACLIRSGFKTILIDTGGSVYYDIGNDCLIPYLKSKRIYNLDLVITTHDDYDHSGALETIKENFTVKEYINSASDFPFRFANINFTNLNNHIDEASEENAKSLVISFSLFDKDFLIMGDAPISVENSIMNEYSSIPCDVLKVGHHGSNTSTSESFIRYLRPETAIISVGKNNYGHPHQSVLNILKRNNVTIRRTDKEGSISFSEYIFM